MEQSQCLMILRVQKRKCNGSYSILMFCGSHQSITRISLLFDNMMSESLKMRAMLFSLFLSSPSRFLPHIRDECEQYFVKRIVRVTGSWSWWWCWPNSDTSKDITQMDKSLLKSVEILHILARFEQKRIHPQSKLKLKLALKILFGNLCLNRFLISFVLT